MARLSQVVSNRAVVDIVIKPKDDPDAEDGVPIRVVYRPRTATFPFRAKGAALANEGKDSESIVHMLRIIESWDLEDEDDDGNLIVGADGKPQMVPIPRTVKELNACKVPDLIGPVIQACIADLAPNLTTGQPSPGS